MIIQSEQIDKKTNFALCMILAGGISNLIDRIFRGFVIDFIDISTIINFPKFNFVISSTVINITKNVIKSTTRKVHLNHNNLQPIL